MPPADIEIEKHSYAYGVDSLVAIDIRYWFLKEFNVQVAVFKILRGESIAGLCFLVASKTQYQLSWTEEPIKDGDGPNSVYIKAAYRGQFELLISYRYAVEHR
jgi:hypothetical protein